MYIPASSQQYLLDISLLLYVQSWTPDGGRKDRPKHIDCYTKINKFETLVHLVGFTIEITDLLYPSHLYVYSILLRHYLLQ